MKSFFCAAALMLLTLFSLSASERLISFDAGLSSGIPVYGDKEINEFNSEFSVNGHRVIFGTVCDVNFKVSDILTVFIGNDSIFDFCWNDTGYSHHIETAVFPGVKIYPGLGGFNFSCAYSVGKRWDFITADELPDVSFWGNGFRLGAEYNFSYKTNNHLPSLGVYYRFCPRGSYHFDNLISIYCVVNF